MSVAPPLFSHAQSGVSPPASGNIICRLKLSRGTFGFHLHLCDTMTAVAIHNQVPSKLCK